MSHPSRCMRKRVSPGYIFFTKLIPNCGLSLRFLKRKEWLFIDFSEQILEIKRSYISMFTVFCLESCCFRATGQLSHQVIQNKPSFCVFRHSEHSTPHRSVLCEMSRRLPILQTRSDWLHSNKLFSPVEACLSVCRSCFITFPLPIGPATTGVIDIGMFC